MKVFPVLVVVVSTLASAPAADAQWRSERPYRGLFGGGADVSETEQSLTASGSLGTGWDDNLVADLIGRNVLVSDVNQRFKGGVTTASGTLSYSLNRSAVALGATAGTTGRYYPSLEDKFVRREYASVGASAILGAGFSTQATAVYQPYNLRSMMPSLFEPRLGDPVIVDEDFPASLDHYFGYSAGAGFTRNLTPRYTFNASYDYHARNRAGRADMFQSQGAGADLSYLLSRDLTLRMGYGYREALYGGHADNHASHVIDVGLDYSHRLSFSRRTSLSFGTGSTAMRRSRNEALRFRVNGSARLSHEIGRTWLGSLTYNRGLQFVETWPEPVYTDSATAAFTGFISRRVQSQVTGRWLRGRSYFDVERDRLESYGASAGLSVAITRNVNSGVVYTYYQHRFANLIAPIPGLPGELERQSVRAFVSVWVPLFQVARRP